MEKLATFIIITVLLSSCGPTLEEREEIAIIACNIIGESRNMDAAMRIREINTARDEIGEAAFLETDETIREAIQYDLCGELVMNDPEYTSKLNDLKRLAEQVRSEIPKARFMELVLAITPYKYAMELAAKGDAGDEYAAIEGIDELDAGEFGIPKNLAVGTRNHGATMRDGSVIMTWKYDQSDFAGLTYTVSLESLERPIEWAEGGTC